jgi:hypothetical protein
MRKHTVQNVTVGIFVSVALAVLALAVFVIGQERSMFKRKTRLWTSFSDINGLVVGAPVRLAGVDVGRVQAIDFASELNQLDARISLVIEDRYMGRVRSDSRAYIDSKGLLGDKIINVSVGTPKGLPLNEGDYLTPKLGLSFESLAQEVEATARAIGDAAQRTGGAVKVGTRTDREPDSIQRASQPRVERSRGGTRHTRRLDRRSDSVRGHEDRARQHRAQRDLQSVGAHDDQARRYATAGEAGRAGRGVLAMTLVVEQAR